MSTQRFIFSYFDAKASNAALSASLSPACSRTAVSSPRISAKAASSPAFAALASASPASVDDENVICLSSANTNLLVLSCTTTRAKAASASTPITTRFHFFVVLFAFDSIFNLLMKVLICLIRLLNDRFSRPITDGVRLRPSGAQPVRAFLPYVAGSAALPCFHGPDYSPRGLPGRLRSCANGYERNCPRLYAGHHHCRQSSRDRRCARH